MSLSSFLLNFLAKNAFKKHSKESKSALENQEKIFKHIVSNGHRCDFAQDFGITKTLTYGEFVDRVPLMVYEDFKKYIDLISFGGRNVLTRGTPSYFAITSGTTSGTKYIPLTKEMMNMQTKATKELLLLYAYQRGYYNISGAGMMFVQGTPKLNYFNKVPYGKLSGIAAHHVPFYLKKNRFPSMKTNCIEPWEKKIQMIVKETLNKDLRILGGIPPWVMTYFKEVLRRTGANTIKEVFPNLQLYIHGGTSFQSYQKSFFDLCGQIDTLEVYPASEGFFAYQNSIEDKSLALLTNHGVFYEFVRLGDFNKSSNPDRISLEGVELNVDYVMVVSTIAGLWSYNTGDTIRFVSKNPYKIMFSGRASQFCSAFGEHVIEKEVQVALNEALRVCGGSVLEFTVAPKVSSKNSRHDWFIEFSSAPENLGVFKDLLCKEMGKQNLYYRDLIESGVIETIGLYVVKNGGFAAYMKSIGKFGGQNKCPHLSNNRNVADFLIKNHVKK